MLFKRPVIEYGDNLIVAWDEEEYKKIFYKSSLLFLINIFSM